MYSTYTGTGAGTGTGTGIVYSTFTGILNLAGNVEFINVGNVRTLTQTINYITLETNTSTYVIDEQDEERIVTEIGEGTQSKFVNGETITGSVTGATATILVEDSRNSYIYITGQQLFENGPDIIGFSKKRQYI